MKKVDICSVVLFIFILCLSILTLPRDKVLSQNIDSSSSSSGFAVCITCAVPECSPGQRLTKPDDCKCSNGNIFDGQKCIESTEPVACILLFDPVCGCNGKTYSNSCFAHADGVKKFSPGECSQNCTSDNDCPLGKCNDGSTYQAYSCLDEKCHELNFFVDPCQFSTSGGLNNIEISKNYTGIWRGRVKEKNSKLSKITTLRLCVINDKLEGLINQNDNFDNAIIIQKGIENNPNGNQIVQVEALKTNGENETLRLLLINERRLRITFSNDTFFIARKINLNKKCGPTNCTSQGSCRGENGEELLCPPGTECSGLPAYGCYPPGCPVPICLSPDTRIKTKSIEKRIAEIKEGDIVLTDNEKPVKVIKINKVKVKNHKMLKVTFNDGIILEISSNHPTADGKLFKDLKVGDKVDNRLVAEIRLVPYDYQYTYDILPDSKTGNYYANGILVGSTLKRTNKYHSRDAINRVSTQEFSIRIYSAIII